MVRELRDKGFPASKERVERLMRENGIRARHKQRFKASMEKPLPCLIATHLQRIIGLDQATAHESTQDAPAGIGLHLCDRRGIEPGGGVKEHARSLPQLDDGAPAQEALPV